MTKGVKYIAEQAGVSVSTVSHVLNGTASISTEVHERVLRIARQSGYLATRRRKATISALSSIMLATSQDKLTQSDQNFFSWVVLHDLRQECERRALRVITVVSPSNHIDRMEVAAAARANTVDGLILMQDDDSDLLKTVRAIGVPSVIISGQDMSMEIDSVSPANRAAAHMATEYLVGLGHRAIGHITFPGRRTIRQRYDGYRDALREAALSTPEGGVIETPDFGPFETIERVVTEWYDRRGGLGGITAFFCAADNLAIGLIRALQARGVRVPEDVSVLGFDDMLLGASITPALSTIQIPLNQLGLAALGLLEERLLDRDPARAARRLELGCRLIKRDSVVPLRR